MYMYCLYGKDWLFKTKFRNDKVRNNIVAAIEPCNRVPPQFFRFQRKLLFHVLIRPYDFHKNFVANHKWSTSPKIPDFQYQFQKIHRQMKDAYDVALWEETFDKKYGLLHAVGK